MNGISMPGKPGSNRHPVDQLANIRATIKTLQDREKQLKEEIVGMMGDATSLGGAEFIAELKPGSRKGGLDEAKLSKKLGDLSAYRKADSHFSVLNVEPRVLEGFE